MQNDFWNMEIGKKKDVYPSKKSINLYYSVNDSKKISTIVIDVVFVLVLVLGIAKFFVFDVIAEKNAAYEKLQSAQELLAVQEEALKDFDEVSEEYSRYSYKILVDGLGLHDRMAVLDMLENTVFNQASISSVSINDNKISLNVDGMGLDEIAQLIAELQSYEMVEFVEITNQSGNGESFSGNMSITLTTLIETEAGGEQ